MAAPDSGSIAVVGAGLIGRAWSISFARAGHRVRLWDAAEGAAAAAVGFIDTVLGDLARNELLGGAAPEELRRRIEPVPKLEDALAGAAHVQENTPEQLESKRQVFAELDRLAAPETVLASSTSGFVPSSFTETLAGRARTLVVHPINPPYLVPAVEIVPAPWTAPEVVERTRALMAAAGHQPIVMRRELEGFVMNRLQGALLEEAFRLVASGACSAEDVDRGLKDGLALRWSFIGPFETIDLNAPGGVADYVRRYEPLYRRLFAEMTTRVEWGGAVLGQVEAERRERLGADRLEERQRWRDRRLMALLRHKLRASREIGD
jgi:3-hydroxyacyl-CoA dehydrogenase